MSSSWMACLLKSRSVIRFRGPETIKLLQGLVTNDLRSLENAEPVPKHDFTPNMPDGVTPLIYAAMLNPKGRFLYDLFFYRPPQPNEKLNRTGSGPGPEPSEIEIYADVDKDVIDVLLSTLKRYRLRLKVDIEDATGDFSCWQCFGEELSKSSASLQNLKSGSVGWGGTVDDIAVSSSGGSSLGWDWSRDPRLACLGFRGIFPSNEIPPLVEADQETDERNFLLWRVQKGVAEGSTEIPEGEAVPLEYNLAGLNAISFDKGCYVGQELVARTHHRGEIRKRLLPLQFDNQKNEQVTPGSEVVTAESQKKAGIVTTVVGSHGLGVLRLDEAFRTSEPLVIKDQENVQVKTFKPKWWPSEWLPDH